MNPIISIITVVKNEAAVIENCIRSIASQSIEAEHLLIDGGSTDQTLQIAQKLKHQNLIIHSEQDQGAYDAMNKGIRLARGEIVGILNADDQYYDNRVLKRVQSTFETGNSMACYGDLLYVDRDDIGKVCRYWQSGSYNRSKFYWGWMPPHPTFFVRRTAYENYGGFNLSLGSAADYELMLRFLLRHGISAEYIPSVLVKMRMGGVSNRSLRNRLLAHSMDRKAWKINGLKPFPWTLWLKPIRKINQYFSKPAGT